jgi:cytochrome c-type biogenesis protein CcmH/NrfG
MSEENQQQPVEQPAQQPAATPAQTGWTSTQVYAMAVLCLIVGVTVGYLFRGSNSATPAAQPAAVQQQPGAPGGMPGGMSGGMSGGMQQPPTAEQLKAMADKQVAPLLEQVKQNPKDTEAMNKIGTFYLAAQQFDLAQQWFQKSVDVKATAESLTKLANAQFYGGSGEKALSTLDKALQLDPNYANALYNKGMLKWQVRGDLKGAVDSWEKLLKITSKDNPNREKLVKLIEHAKQQEGMSSAKGKNDTPR